MDDVNEGPRWTPPTPGTGSKRRDAAKVAELLALWRPTTIALATAGLGGELAEYTGPANIIVADPDPAVRALWHEAQRGSLAFARERAIDGWRARVAAHGGDVRKAWAELRHEEPIHDPRDHAAWALTIFSGSINGLRRRNPRGIWNASHLPTYLPDTVERRMGSDEVMRACDAWAAVRQIDVRRSFDEACHLMLSRLVVRPVITLDPPYGREAGNVYGGDWTDARLDRLIERATEAAALGTRLIVWCGTGDIERWRRVPGMAWTFRETRTCMKAPTVAADGTVREARKADGGWMGWSA